MSQPGYIAGTAALPRSHFLQAGLPAFPGGKTPCNCFMPTNRTENLVRTSLYSKFRQLALLETQTSIKMLFLCFNGRLKSTMIEVIRTLEHQSIGDKAFKCSI